MWSPDSWKCRPALQQALYPDAAELDSVLAQLRALPPLVTSWEIVTLRSLLAEACEGKRFVLQGGDCAERFADCESPKIANQLKILLQMSLVLVQGSQRPVIRVGRFAGQYAKPRSEDFEERGGKRLPSYRGDLVNRPAFTEDDRRADPQLLLRAYERSALTLNFCRALVKGGFADLHHPEYWDLDFARHSPLADEYHGMVAEISRALRFMENVLGVRAGESDRIDFYTSHEALHLHYEQAHTRQVPHRSGWFNLGVHFPWIGVRTSGADGAHVEYCRGIENPVAVKIGPSATQQQVLSVIERLNPGNEPGRLALIHRLGRQRIEAVLPGLIEWVRDAGAKVLWICDPMHGNTRLTSDGIKTRNFDDILGELEIAFALHGSMGSYMGGVHIELTGENVTECVGGARGLSEADLRRAYISEVDPRLNYEQALEMALSIARKMRPS